MRNVFFDNASSRQNRLLAIPMVVFMLIYILTAFYDQGSLLHKISAILGFGFSVVFLGKQFAFRNYLGWNKKGMVLKLNSFFSKTISFEHIHDYSFENENLEIIRKNGSRFNFSLKDIKPDHIDRIREVISSHTSIHGPEEPSLT
jgi:hypothetical protein